jgi:hypothetical protein
MIISRTTIPLVINSRSESLPHSRFSAGEHPEQAPESDPPQCIGHHLSSLILAGTAALRGAANPAIWRKQGFGAGLLHHYYLCPMEHACT